MVILRLTALIKYQNQYLRKHQQENHLPNEYAITYQHKIQLDANLFIFSPPLFLFLKKIIAKWVGGENPILFL